MPKAVRLAHSAMEIVQPGDKKTGAFVKQPAFTNGPTSGRTNIEVGKKVVSENHLIFGGLTATLSCAKIPALPHPLTYPFPLRLLAGGRSFYNVFSAHPAFNDTVCHSSHERAASTAAIDIICI